MGLALSNREDKHHKVAKAEYENIKTKGNIIVVSDYILDETITALFRNANFDSAVQFIESLFAGIEYAK